jgi:hypothetical protein
MSLGTAPSSKPSFVAKWGKDKGSQPWWPSGTYTITAACTMSGHSAVSATKTVHIT